MISVCLFFSTLILSLFMGFTVAAFSASSLSSAAADGRKGRGSIAVFRNAAGCFLSALEVFIGTAMSRCGSAAGLGCRLLARHTDLEKAAYLGGQRFRIGHMPRSGKDGHLSHREGDPPLLDDPLHGGCIVFVIAGVDDPVAAVVEMQDLGK